MIRLFHRRWMTLGMLSLFILKSALPVWGAYSSRDAGTTTANFLKLGTGARCEAMGEACSALVNEAEALYWNPADLTLIPKTQTSVTFMHAPYLDPTYFDFIGVAHHTENGGAFGAGLQYFSGGAIPQTDTSGTTVGRFNPYDMALSLGYAATFYGYAFGATGKYIESKLQTSAHTMAVDFGMLSPAYFHDRFRLALAESNIGGRMTFDQEAYRLPQNLKIGSAWSLSPTWKMTFDLNFPIDNDPYEAVGSEYQWIIHNGWVLVGRVGYNTRSSRNIDGLSGPTAGFGTHVRNYAFDYAMVPMGTLGLTHRLSISIRFSGEPAQTIRTPSAVHAQRDQSKTNSSFSPNFFNIP